MAIVADVIVYILLQITLDNSLLQDLKSFWNLINLLLVANIYIVCV